jgi:uncharacterized Zn-finger protein
MEAVYHEYHFPSSSASYYPCYQSEYYDHTAEWTGQHPSYHVPYSEPSESSSTSEWSDPHDEKTWYTIRKKDKRIYVCNRCSKEFTRSFNLKDHYKATHLGLKPFQCEVANCSSRFARKNDCLRHMKLVHKEK